MSSTPSTRRARRGLAAGLGLGLAASVLSVATAPAAHAAPVSFTLLDINDYHGRISSDGGSGSGDATTYSTVEFATTIQGIRNAAEADPVLLLSAGDNIGASLFNSSFTDDQPTIDVLNRLGLATSALGNHEFDKGYDWLKANVIDGNAQYRKADFPLLGANVYLKGTQTLPPGVQAYSTHQVAGVNVCVIGAITQETPTLVSPDRISTLEFGDPVDAVNRVATQLETAGTCDVTVATYHDGAGAGTPDGSSLEDEIAAGGPFAKIVNQTAGAVDVIFTGHTHKEYSWTAPKPGGGTRPIVQTGSYGQKLGRVDLTVDPTTDAVTVDASSLVTVGTTENLADPVVADVDTITRAAETAANVVGDVPEGNITADVTTAYTGGAYTNGKYTGGSRDDRLSESALGNLVADALKDTPITDIPGLPTPVIGVVNPGGLRNELLYAANLAGSPQDADGVVTFEEANAVLPFANNISYVTLTGAEFKQVLEQQWQTTADGVTRPSRPFLHLGLSKNVQVVARPDTSATSPVGNNILSVTVDGQPLDPAKEYVVSTFSFLAAGGDNFRAFKLGTNRDTAKVDRDLWIEGYFGNGQAKAPTFARRQVFATGLPTEPLVPGTVLDLQLSKLNLTSQGAPANTTVEARAVLGGAATSLGSFPVTNGAADVDLTVPEDAYGKTIELVAQPSGTTVDFPIAKAESTVSATVARSAYGRPSTVAVKVTSDAPANGTAQAVVGGKVVATGAVTNGAATLTVPAKTLKPGTTPVSVRFTGPQAADSTATASAVVTKAAPRVKVVKAAKRVVVKKTRVRLRVLVSATGYTPTGKVQVAIGGVKYNATVRNGKAVVVLKPFRSTGTKNVRVRYLGNSLASPAATSVKIKVKRK
ncbi:MULTISPECIES: bifunctional metallophosphatase/5'-nucleotidase [unclassified Nocardioides]|uniref:bifunctional metallophosphatase/5'-nucleotidase n=1 Tax=unclassified Nocardioides TaxID=2615069 RepID=UPI0030154BF7